MGSFRGRLAFLSLLLTVCVAISCGGGGTTGGNNPPPQPPPQPPSQPPPANAPVITLQSAQFQTWEAWRATATGPNFPHTSGTSQPLPSSLLNAILDDLAFDLGLNGVRVHLHYLSGVEVNNDDDDWNHIDWADFGFARPFSLGGVTVDLPAEITQVVLPLRQRVMSRNEKFYTYISPHYPSANFPSHWHQPEEYAEFAEAAVLWLGGRSSPPPGFSLVPDYWTILNEPDLNGMPANELTADVIAVGNRFALSRVNVPTKVQVVETVSPNPSYLNTVLNNAQARAFVGLISFHGYDYNSLTMPASFTSRNQIRNAARANGLRTAMTEICCRSTWRGDYPHALGWARDIYWNLTEADISVWEPLAVMFTCANLGCTNRQGADPIQIDRDHSRYFKFANYYALRQYSRFIRPGYVRMDATCNNCGSDNTLGQLVKPVVFRSPGGKHVIVVINDTTTAQDIYFAGFPTGTYDITGIDPAHETSPVTYPAQTISSGQNLRVNFPAQAILTIVQR